MTPFDSRRFMARWTWTLFKPVSFERLACVDSKLDFFSASIIAFSSGSNKLFAVSCLMLLISFSRTRLQMENPPASEIMPLERNKSNNGEETRARGLEGLTPTLKKLFESGFKRLASGNLCAKKSGA